MTSSPGFSPAAFTWLDQLAADNSRAFFDASRTTYDTEVRAPFAALLTEAARENDGTARVFRQLRDLRFERNRERPYWESIAGEIIVAGATGALGVEFATDGLRAWAGQRRPFSADQLARYRAAIDEDAGAELEDIAAHLHDEGCVLGGTRLRTVPRGFPRDHRHAVLLRHDALWACSILAPQRVRRRGITERRTVRADIAQAFLAIAWEQMQPLRTWLDDHVGAPADASVPA
ncbi:MAG: DUF2461 family protein [Solirubrobacteraceae bacterium]|nr:DUF2461 family protein [Solirubrobacteraceae bacterium]